jgi:hypothetical protein
MEHKVTITMLKNLLREYNRRRRCCIWRDAVGVHICELYTTAVIYGELRWARYKWER